MGGEEGGLFILSTFDGGRGGGGLFILSTFDGGRGRGLIFFIDDNGIDSPRRT